MSIKKQTLSRLRTIVHELINARYMGASAGRIFRAQGMADGYMRALVDLKVATDREILALIDEEQSLAQAKFSSGFGAAMEAPSIASSMAPKIVPNWA